MIIIRFPDDKAKRRALGFLPGRFSFKSWATGEMMVPENSLPFLAVEGIPFSVEGPANYERLGLASYRLKARLKSRFQQKDIWLTTYPIEVI